MKFLAIRSKPLRLTNIGSYRQCAIGQIQRVIAFSVGNFHNTIFQ